MRNPSPLFIAGVPLLTIGTVFAVLGLTTEVAPFFYVVPCFIVPGLVLVAWPR
ncbi:hypothetical protein [Stutzerimonas azotifigens]|uniref:Uncharacterized protein n=1 Tax=Stutzerimonas azotifigens TaxID=291995 RepID=A0ABR5YWU3_9GAMM|nr:hypothetical protein [Stutzerimonas azotifigens]MBA1272401.1 hypothetical protein [Stutzerimonas azotifigens]